MEVPVKFQLGQTVWINDIPKPKQIRLQSLKIICRYCGGTGDRWGDHDSRGQGWPFQVYYSVHTTPPKECDWISQEVLFATKEELIKGIL